MRIAILARAGASTSVLLNWLQDRGHRDLHVILEDPPSRWRQFRFRWRKLGLLAALGQVCFVLLVQPWLKRSGRARRRALMEVYGLRDSAPDLAISLQLGSANRPEAVALLKALAPKVVLVNGTGILRQPVLAATDAPFVNVHAGITPLYRGVHGGYWALHAEDRRNFGVTVHLVDAGVDTGPVLGECRPEPSPADNFCTYPLLQQAAAFPLLADVLDMIAAGDQLSPLTAVASKGRQWYHPTILQYLTGRFRGIK